MLRINTAFSLRHLINFQLTLWAGYCYSILLTFNIKCSQWEKFWICKSIFSRFLCALENRKTCTLYFYNYFYIFLKIISTYPKSKVQHCFQLFLNLFLFCQQDQSFNDYFLNCWANEISQVFFHIYFLKHLGIFLTDFHCQQRKLKEYQ